MPASRLIVLGVAIAAAGGAGYFAKNMVVPPPPPVQDTAAPKAAVQTTDVLTLSADVPTGEPLEGKLTWSEWPQSGISTGFITRTDRPDALEELSKGIARVALFAGEPLRESKLASGRSILSSLLPSGKRAVATQITADTSAGGFVLPNDYVDVIMVRRSQSAAQGAQGFTTETILKNIKVLAIDQTIEENDQGEKTKIGQTATLELTPEQAEIISVAQQMADRLTLALRSIADSQEKPTDDADYLVSRSGKAGTIRLIKSGEITEVGSSK